MQNPFENINNRIAYRVTQLGGKPTLWSFDELSTEITTYQPSFFTPFHEQHASMKQAAITVGLLPALNLGAALFLAIIAPPVCIFDSIKASINGDWTAAGDSACGAVASPILATYCLGSFVINLLKEITAFITRSIATLVAMNSGSDELAIESNHEDETEAQDNRMEPDFSL